MAGFGSNLRAPGDAAEALAHAGDAGNTTTRQVVAFLQTAYLHIRCKHVLGHEGRCYLSGLKRSWGCDSALGVTPPQPLRKYNYLAR